MALLDISDLDIVYHIRGEHGDVHAVNDVDLSIDEEEYYGLVGESGCGKSTIAKTIIGGLDENGEITDGTISYRGEEIQHYTEDEFNEKLRWKAISMIPQASMNSLDPITKISTQAVEVARYHTDWSEQAVIERLQRLFDIVGLAESRIHEYPHQFSGGMQQRVIIAFALLLDPDLVIADEPTTALDVIMQDQIFGYLNDIRSDQSISLLLITHDISVVLENCDSMAVMHGGQVVESGATTTIFDEPRHPYSILLQQAFPDIRDRHRELSVIEGTPPQLRSGVDYCTFAERCPWAIDECTRTAPPLQPVDGSPDHRVACIRSDEMEELAVDYLGGVPSE